MKKPFEQAMEMRDKAMKLPDCQSKLTLLLMAKSIAKEARLVSLVCDLMADIADVKAAINKQRKRECLEPDPIHMFAGVGLSDEEILNHKMKP